MDTHLRTVDKQHRSIYKDYPNYKEYPFSTNKKFGVHYYKRKDEIQQIIEKHDKKRGRWTASTACLDGGVDRTHEAIVGFTRQQKVPSSPIFKQPVPLHCCECNDSNNHQP